jgi:ectoine hydroxylase-related dioxygenase (phytanoyl-CoA dioxygenase family)
MQVRELTTDEVARYQADGVAFLRRLTDGQTVQLLLDEADRRKSHPGPFSSNLSKSGDFFEERMSYRESQLFRDFALSSGLAKAVAPAMATSEVRLFFDHLFMCGPNTPTEYYWHQDLPYWPVEGDQICSVWLALTDCDRESSALELIPDTHKGPLYGVREFGDAEDYGGATERSGGDKIPEYHLNRETHKVISRDVKAGDAFIFHAKTMHGSGGNRSKDRRRVAYSTRWIGDDVRDCSLFPLVWQPAS